MTNEYDTVVEKLKELEAQVNIISANSLVPLQDMLTREDDAGMNTWLLVSELEEVARYIDETDVEVRQSRIEPRIDGLVELYERRGLSELIRLEATTASDALRQAASANLSAHGIDPTKAVRVVILELAVNRQPGRLREWQIDQWARTLVGVNSPWMVFGYFDGISFREDFDHGEYSLSSSSEALGLPEGEQPRTEPHTALCLGRSDTHPPVYQAKSAGEIYRKMYQLTVCLQLYTGKAVRLLMTHLRPCFTPSRDHLYRHWVTAESLFVDYYSVATEEHASLVRTLDRILPALADLGVQPDGYGADYRVIAVKHYSDSLLHSDLLEKTASVVISLEALYGLGGAELQYSLKQRIARLTGPVLNDYDSISAVVKKAYETRSGFLHGEKPKLPEQADIDLLLRIARISIQLALLLDMKKEDFVSMLDRAMVNNEKARELVEKVLLEYGTIQ